MTRLINRLGFVILLLSMILLPLHYWAKAHPVPSPCMDFVTGGGFFFFGLPKQANFGFNAGFKGPNQTAPSGHLNYIDHNDGMHVSSTSVDSYEGFACGDACGDCADRVFGGTAKVNGVPGYTYLVEVIDAGEPGRHDRFRITVTGPGGFFYTADSGDGFPCCPADGIDGGNIQIHKPCNGISPKQVETKCA